MTSDEEWVQQLLSALPEPRIPDDVRQRLAAAIAEESATSMPHELAAATVVPLQRQRQRAVRRRPVLAGLIGAAAALSLFAVIDPLATVDQTQSDSTMASEQGPESGQPQDAAGSTTAVVLATDTSYNRAELPAQAQLTARVAASADSPPLSGKAAAESSAGAVRATEQCAAAIPDQHGTLVFVDRAMFEGTSALIVAFRTGGQLDVVVLGPDCTRTDPAVEYRVTVEDPRGSGE